LVTAAWKAKPMPAAGREERGRDGSAVASSERGQGDHARDGHQPCGPPGRGARGLRAALWLADGDEHDDARQREQRTADGTAPDVLVGQAHADREGEHQAHGAQRLHHDEAAAVERGRLEHPAERLRQPAEQPDRLADDLRQEVGIALGRVGVERAPLLEHRPEREGQGCEERDEAGHAPTRRCRRRGRWARTPVCRGAKDHRRTLEGP
jgi:hypothetical protein